MDLTTSQHGTLILRNQPLNLKSQVSNALIPHSKQVNATIMAQNHLLIVDSICANERELKLQENHNAIPNIKRLQFTKNWI